MKINPHNMRKNAFQNMQKKYLKKNAGVTMIELLIVVAIIGVLFVIWMLLTQTQLGRSRDAQRKADLDRIQTAFENYYNDNHCYPDQTVLQACQSDEFKPYLSKIPCDPITDDPYLYVPLEGDQCKGYRVYAALENDQDPGIANVGCDDVPNCGVVSPFNYGVSVGVPVVMDGYTPPEIPAGTPPLVPVDSGAPEIYVFACDAAGTCNQYEQNHPYLMSCPITFQNSNCNNRCGTIGNRCAG